MGSGEVSGTGNSLISFLVGTTVPFHPRQQPITGAIICLPYLLTHAECGKICDKITYPLPDSSFIRKYGTETYLIVKFRIC